MEEVQAVCYTKSITKTEPEDEPRHFINYALPMPKYQPFKIQEQVYLVANDLSDPASNLNFQEPQSKIPHILYTYNVGYKNSTVNMIFNDLIKYESINNLASPSTPDLDCPIEHYVLWSGLINDQEFVSQFDEMFEAGIGECDITPAPAPRSSMGTQRRCR